MQFVRLFIKYELYIVISWTVLFLSNVPHYNILSILSSDIWHHSIFKSSVVEHCTASPTTTALYAYSGVLNAWHTWAEPALFISTGSAVHQAGQEFQRKSWPSSHNRYSSLASESLAMPFFLHLHFQFFCPFLIHFWWYNSIGSETSLTLSKKFIFTSLQITLPGWNTLALSTCCNSAHSAESTRISHPSSAFRLQQLKWKNEFAFIELYVCQIWHLTVSPMRCALPLILSLQNLEKLVLRETKLFSSSYLNDQY